MGINANQKGGVDNSLRSKSMHPLILDTAKFNFTIKKQKERELYSVKYLYAQLLPGHYTGMVKKKVEPLPNSDSIQILPPSISI